LECVDNPKQITLLLIGETGVGKSTFINAFANYCKFKSLQEAAQAGGVFPITYDFQLPPHPQTKRMISISSEGTTEIPQNSKFGESGKASVPQHAKVGDSVTVMPNEYFFPYENTQINLIDTPGLMDTKDEHGSHETDKEHVNNILRLLSTYDEIHAICILVKGSENRISNAFKYTLTEIMRHLDTDACNNVIFILTHRNSKSEQTEAILQAFLEENNLLIPLPPDKPTVYCFDNDTVRYLAKCKNKIPQSEDDKDDAETNWTRSVRSTKEMFEYVCSLYPHSLEKIMTIYDADHTVRILSKLVLETLICICKDENDLKHKTSEAKEAKAQIANNPAALEKHNLRQLLLITETKVVRTALDHTIVVCESPTCAKFVNGERVYPQICCERCDSKMMYWCSFMNCLGNCKICRCGRKKHVWRNTKTEIVKKTVYQPDDKDSTVTGLTRTISNCTKRLKMYHNETDQMLRTCAKLNTFVHQNVLVATEDELSRSLQNEIETCVRITNNPAESETHKDANISRLRQIQSQYNHFLDMEKNSDDNTYDVHELIQKLYRLEMKGKDLHNAMEEEEKAVIRVIQEGKKVNKVKTLMQIFGRKP